MLNKPLKYILLLITLLVSLQVFHHQIAMVWHKLVHIVHAEDHHHHHHELKHEIASNESIKKKSLNNHEHKSIQHFLSHFKCDYSMNNSDSESLFVNAQLKYLKLVCFEFKEHSFNIFELKSSLSNEQNQSYIIKVFQPPQA